jgi:methyl-accepting chemotaxis protein
VENPQFKEALKRYAAGNKEGTHYIEETGNKRLLTYLIPIEKRRKCNACHTQEGFRGILMISTSLEEMYANLALSRTRWLTYGISTISLVSLFLSIIVRLVVTRPITQTTSMLKEIAEGQGDLTARIKVSSEDEVGMMGTWFNKFVIGMQEMVRGILTISNEIASGSGNISRSSGGMQKAVQAQLLAAEETSSSILEMDASIKNVAVDAERLFASAQGASASSEAMATAITDIAKNAESLAVSADQTTASINEIVSFHKKITSHIDSLHARTEQAGAASLEITATVKEVETLSKEQATFAESMVSVATNYLADVNKSGQAVENIVQNISQTSLLMNKLGERSKEIGSIIEIIKDVTEATNLLSINATILAAQAGEHGKGFAVVAEEIKTLSERTSTSTKEVASLIAQVQEDVVSAIQSVEQSSSAVVNEMLTLSKGANKALTNVSESARTSYDMAKKISQAAGEQANGISQVADSIQGINKMAEEIKNDSDIQVRASDEILSAVERMHEITLKVKGSTAEQSRTGMHIFEVINDFKDRMQGISKAIGEHKKASETLVRAIETIQKETEQNASRTGDLDRTVQSLNTLAESLKTNVNRFKV